MEYFLDKNGQKVGPYDMMSIIKKIKNGSITSSDKIIDGLGGEPELIIDVPKFKAIFNDDLEENFASKDSSAKTYKIKKLSLKNLLKGGVEFLKNNQDISLTVGMFLIIAIIGNMIFFSAVGMGFIFAVISSIWNYFILALLQIAILRKARMQLLSFEYFKKTIKRFGVQLGICSVILGIVVFAVPSILSILLDSQYPLMLILVPGSFLLMVFFYAPLIIVDHGVTAKMALGQSLSFIKNSGAENFIILYTLMVDKFYRCDLLYFASFANITNHSWGFQRDI